MRNKLSYIFFATLSSELKKNGDMDGYMDREAFGELVCVCGKQA